MKKLFALLLALVMVLSMVACQKADPTTGATEPSKNNNVPVVTDPTTQPTQPAVEPEALPENPLLYWGFETLEGLTPVAQLKDDAGAITGLGQVDKPILVADGVVGKSLYLDGKYGYQLDMKGLDIADDSYTISFWIYAERLGDFMPIVQMGRNINSADANLPTTWLNFTRGSWAETYPLAWNRNTSIPWATDENGVFPWIAGPADVVYGKGEWCLITLVVDGNRYTCLDDNGERIGTRYYLNGELVFDASAEFLYYQGVAPELFTGSPVDGFIGINYWDSVYKGYIDELTVYDEALTSGQVLSLYQKGDATMTPSAPVEGGGVEEEPEIVLPEITPDANAIDTLGTTERNLAWWSEFTGSYELADGQTLNIKLNNYSNAEQFYKNFVFGLCNSSFTTDVLPNSVEGYAEYLVVRPDAWGWTTTANPYGTYTPSWTDFNAWIELMKDAEVTIEITRNGASVSGTMTFVGADGTVMTETFEALDIMAADAPCYVFVGGEGAYIELLSVN